MVPTRPARWVGRESELAVFHAGLQALERGEGTVIWVEGEPGIGKSALVAEALAQGDRPGLEVGWGGADQLTRLPLRVMQDCLGVRPDSPDPRRAGAARLLRSRWEDPDADGASVNGMEVLLTLADELCATAPTVLVLDDLQWADDASLAVWHQLAASISQMRLLLIATCRPTPRTAEVRQVRAAVKRRGGQLLTLGPLGEPDVTTLVGALVGAQPGEELRRLTAQAAGNPLYVREIVDVLVRESRVQICTVADVAPQSKQLPISLSGVLDERLGSVSEETAQILRTAAMLGGRFAVTDLAVVMSRAVTELAPGLQEALAAGIVEGAGADLAFRHPLIRQALYDGMPEALRTALHAEAARELAAADADVLSVAQQLAGAGRPGGGWVRDWLLRAAPVLVIRAPQLAVQLLRAELEGTSVSAEAWEALMVGLVRGLVAVGAYDEAVSQASGALAVMADPDRRGETSWMLAHAQVSAGRGDDDAVSTIQRALAAPGLPRKWRARLMALLPMLKRDVDSNFAVIDGLSRQALAAAEEAGDPSTLVHSLAIEWFIRAVERDHVAALGDIDRAIQIIDVSPGHDDLRPNFLDSRTFVLQNLDEWENAELALRQSRDFAQRSGRFDRATWSTAAVLRYWLGQWDDALAELGSDATDVSGFIYSFWRERWAMLLLSGVGALIAVRREQRTAAGRHLKTGLALPIETLTDRENQDFLVAAHAMSLEQGGEPQRAMLRLAEMLPRHEAEMTLIHQWMPDLVRLALAVGDRPQAEAAAAACQREAAAETRPARATAANLRCSGLLAADPDRLAEAVAHYRTVGPAVQLPAALEDLAVVLAERGHEQDARAALNEAVGRYEELQARWDMRRAQGRLRERGVKLGVRGRRGRRATSGWEALTPTEVRIAALIARGDSTADIARGMFLSPRTVRTYISHILTKLDAKSRVDIAREAVSRGVLP